jgi:hypothetical protein
MTEGGFGFVSVPDFSRAVKGRNTRAKARDLYTERFRGFENPLPRTKVRGWHNGSAEPAAEKFWLR